MENVLHMKSDGTIVREITIKFTGKGGERGQQSIKQLVGMIADLKNQPTREAIDTLHSQITGYCKCCMDNEFIDKEAADELMKAVAIATAIEAERTKSEGRKL